MTAAAKKVFEEIETPIGGVMPEQVLPVWDRVAPLLERVVKPETGHSMESVLTELQRGTMQLWIVGDFQAIVVTAIQQRPVQKVLWVQFIAGDNVKDWLDDWGAVQETYARHNNCDAIEFAGRRGWNKYYESHRDYRPKWTIFRKEL